MVWPSNLYNLVLFPFIAGTLISETEGQFVATTLPAVSTLNQVAHLVARLHDSLPCSGLTDKPFHPTVDWRPSLTSLLGAAAGSQAAAEGVQGRVRPFLFRRIRL